MLGDEVKKTIKASITIKDSEFTVETTMEFKNCIGILKYCIKEKLEDTLKSKEDIIEEIITGTSCYVQLSQYPMKDIPTNILVVYANGNYDEKLDILSDNNEDIIVSIDNYYVILVNDTNLNKYFNHINELIDNNAHINYYTSYCKVDSIVNLKNKFECLKENVNICVKYKLKSKIYMESELILERALESMSEVEKSKIYNKYNKELSKLDKDLIRTIDVFLKHELNVSSAAEKLYIHRNTLFYRLDKIKKIFNYDITNFNDATEFKLIFSLWQATKENYII